MNLTAKPDFAIVDATPALVEAALPALVRLLQDCVAGGASIGWPHPPDDATAAAFWRGCIDAAGTGAGAGCWCSTPSRAVTPSGCMNAELAASTCSTASRRPAVPFQGQRGAEVHNPLFELLSAVAEHGSIQHAAKALGASYRHVWGACKHWETVLGEPLVHWVQGQPARLTPFAERLLWAEKRARSRLVPHIEALRAELERVLADALDGSQQVLTVHASHDLALPRCATRPPRRDRACTSSCVCRQHGRAARAGRRPLRGGRLPRAAAGRQPQASLRAA
jgi:molybdate transport repressor ModE-like protein